jgi:ABC-type transporter Mla MlaB component
MQNTFFPGSRRRGRDLCRAGTEGATAGRVRDNPELQLDLSQVTELDSAGLQVLYLAKREAARREHACASSRTATRCAKSSTCAT